MTPAELLLLSPWLDLTLSGHSVRSRIATEVMLDPATIAGDATSRRWPRPGRP
jgi:hypothetical protein